MSSIASRKETAEGAAAAASFRVLIIEDEPLFAFAIARELARHEIPSDCAHTGREGLFRARQGGYGAILIDHRLPDEDGIRLLPALCAAVAEAPVIVMTAYESIPNAIQAIRLGAEDYIVKETSVRPIVERLLEVRRRVLLRRSALVSAISDTGGLLGRSPALKQVEEQLRKVTRGATTTVLLTGETGVGKEVAARHLHALTGAEGQEERPFVAVDCIALPSELVESALFGHEKGAFTGADRARQGAFADADHGTLLLDEIGDMDLRLQGKLLRVLESRRFQRVGSMREHPFHARVVAATNADLEDLCERGLFRFDLYQRLAAFPIHLPPLRERGEDVLLLAEHFAAHFQAAFGGRAEPLSSKVQDCLLAYDYPGNVRELKNIIERAVILAEGGLIAPQHLPERVLCGGTAASASGTGTTAAAFPLDFVPGRDTLQTIEEKMVRQALASTGGSRTEAAKLLGISRFQLLRRLEKYGL